MAKLHHYAIDLAWEGNLGKGTSDYRAYSRDHVFTGGDMPPLLGSADPAFRGDPTRWNPEELLIASIAACHKLWYLHLCCTAGVIVTAYEDHATGVMQEHPDGAGEITEVQLRPKVTITAESDAALAEALHGQVSEKCFIARSVTCKIRYQVEILKA